MPVAETLGALQTRPDGLTAEEAASRKARFGPNRLPPAPKRGLFLRFLLQFHNLLIYVLLGAAGLAAAIGHAADAAVVLAVVLVNAVIGFVQEGRAERALDAIRSMIDPHASVFRDGRRSVIAAENIVPGDLVLLEAGDRVLADLRLMRVRSLRIDEAALTGVGPRGQGAGAGGQRCAARRPHLDGLLRHIRRKRDWNGCCGRDGQQE